MSRMVELQEEDQSGSPLPAEHLHLQQRDAQDAQSQTSGLEPSSKVPPPRSRYELGRFYCNSRQLMDGGRAPHVILLQFPKPMLAWEEQQ